MEHSGISKSMLIADLIICCIWLLCIVHGVENGPVWCRSTIWAVPMLRMWLSFLTYRRSRMALAPIVMLTLLTAGALAGRALSGYALFMQPVLMMLRTIPAFFGESVMTAENIQEIYSTVSDYDVKLGIISSVWLIMIPLGIYIWRCVHKQNEPCVFEIGKRSGLYAYVVSSVIIESMIVSAFHYSFISVFILCLMFMLVPVVFNKGKLDGLFTKGEQTFVMTLVISGIAYTCGIDFSDASTIAVLVIPSLFYLLVCWSLAEEVKYKDILTVLSASFLFVCSQYAIFMYRVILLLVSLGLMSVVLIRLACSTRRFWTSAAVYLMMAVLLPVFSLGYNPYSVLEAGRVMHYDDYMYSPNGLLLVKGKEGCGIRDRYGLVLPAEYDRIEHLIPSKPYCKVKKDGYWLIYDIVRQKLLSEEKFTDVVPCGELTYKLQSPSGDKYLLIPYRYSRFNDDCVAEIVDQLPSERKDRPVSQVGSRCTK